MGINDKASYLEGRMYDLIKVKNLFTRGLLTFDGAQKSVKQLIDDSRDTILCNGNAVDKETADLYVRFIISIEDMIDYFDIDYNW